MAKKTSPSSSKSPSKALPLPQARNKSSSSRESVYLWINSKDFLFVINFLILGFIEFVFQLYNSFIHGTYSKPEEYLNE
jgi:hypothetical protein